MTSKQKELLISMREVLDHEMDYGRFGEKEVYSNYEASLIIKLNEDLFFGIINDGQCTVRQYNTLKKIAGRKPKRERHEISFVQAVDWIKKYSKKEEVEDEEVKKKVSEEEVTHELKTSDQMVKICLCLAVENYIDHVNNFLSDVYDYYKANNYLSKKQINVLRDMFLEDVSQVTKIINNLELDHEGLLFEGGIER